MKVKDQAIVVRDHNWIFKTGDKVTLIKKDDAGHCHVVNDQGIKGWLHEDELRPIEKPSEDDLILFVRLYDGIWETNVEGLVVIYENIVTKPLETTGRYILVDGDYIYLNDQETCAYEKSVEVLSETTISQVEVPLSEGKLIINKNSVTFKP